MFLYISFLKAPPLVSPPSRPLSITPQISNDLRTEPYDLPQDIFYSWSVYTSNPTGLGTTTKPVKLTTWRSSNAYKEIPVPPPNGAREGQAWRLILMAQPQSLGHARPESINLGSGDVGKIPFPVMSLPILFSSRGGKQGQMKQEKIERLYILPSTAEPNPNPNPNPNVAATSSNDHPPTRKTLRLTEQTSFDLDKKIWDSGIGLASWMSTLRESVESLSETQTQIQDLLFSPRALNVVELGAGIGIVSVALAALRSSVNRPEGTHDKIFATDVLSAMPLLEHNISSNVSAFSSSESSPKSLDLDWDEPVLPDEIQTLPTLDLVLMADVTYNTSSFPALIDTLAKLVKLGSPPPVVLFGYKERDAAERTWFELAMEIGVTFQKIGERVGAGGDPVEVWAASNIKRE